MLAIPADELSAKGLRYPECPDADVVLVVEGSWFDDGDARLYTTLGAVCASLGWRWERVVGAG